MKIQLFTLVIIILFCCTSGCNEAFSPSAPFEPKMVIYSILTTQSDTQYVRIYSSYKPPENQSNQSSEEIYVTDASVTISDSATVYRLQPISIPRVDKSRYQNDIKAYYIYPFRPARNKTYTLDITSPTYGKTTVNCTIPGNALFGVPFPEPFQDPCNVRGDIQARFRLAPNTTAFLARFFIYHDAYDYDIGKIVERKYEIPINIRPINPQYAIFARTYPKITRRTTLSNLNPRIANPIQPEEGASWFKYAYSTETTQLWFFTVGLNFKRAVFYLIQFDQAYYNYYQTVNQFQDRYTVRVDEPDFSNINGGFGLFSGITVDSVSYELRTELIPPECPKK